MDAWPPRDGQTTRHPKRVEMEEVARKAQPEFTRPLHAGNSWHLRESYLALPKSHLQPQQSRITAIANMRLSSFGLLAAASSLLSFATAHNIQLKPHQRECFHEVLHKDDKMTVTFQVGDREFGGSGNLEVDFWVRQLRLGANIACQGHG